MNNDTTQANKPIYIKKKIRDLVPGDITLHPIYRTDGLMLVNRNKRLSPSLTEIVKKQALLHTPVLVASYEEKSEKFWPNDKLTSLELKRELELVENEYDNVPAPPGETESLEFPSTTNQFFVNTLTSYPLWASFDHKLESDQLKKRANEVKQELLDCISNNQTFTALFSMIKEYDDILLIHSINITCISLMIGLTLELNVDELLDLAIAALFSNIGFTAVPKENFKDFLKARENNHELIKKHLELFSELTQDSPLLRKKNIVYGILDHHEYYNGKGSPKGKKGEEICLFGRILLIAHTYDELAGGYNYTVGHHPLEALRIVYENRDHKFDNNILNIFMRRTTYFKLGETIVLSNNQKVQIVGFDDYIKSPHLPIIRFKNGKTINLLNNMITPLSQNGKSLL